jgi:hypothetical protein
MCWKMRVPSTVKWGSEWWDWKALSAPSAVLPSVV